MVNSPRSHPNHRDSVWDIFGGSETRKFLSKNDALPAGQPSGTRLTVQGSTATKMMDVYDEAPRKKLVIAGGSMTRQDDPISLPSLERQPLATYNTYDASIEISSLRSHLERRLRDLDHFVQQQVQEVSRNEDSRQSRIKSWIEQEIQNIHDVCHTLKNTMKNMEKTSTDFSSALSKHIQGSEAKISTLDLSLAELTQTVEQYAGVTQQRKIENLERLALSQANEISKLKSETEREKQSRLQLEAELTRRLDQLTVRMDDSISRVATESAQRDGLLTDQVRNVSKTGGYGGQESTILLARLESDVASLAAVLDRRILALEDGSQLLAGTVQETAKDLDGKILAVAQQTSEEIAKARLEAQEALSTSILNGDFSGTHGIAETLHDLNGKTATCRQDVEALAGISGRFESSIEEQKVLLLEYGRATEALKGEIVRAKEGIAAVRSRVDGEIEATRALVSQEVGDCRRLTTNLVNDEKQRFNMKEAEIKKFVNDKIETLDSSLDDMALVVETVRKGLRDETIDRQTGMKELESNLSLTEARLSNRITQNAEECSRSIERSTTDVKGWMAAELERAEGVMRDVLYSEQESLRTFKAEIEKHQELESQRQDANLEKLDRRIVGVVKAVREATLASLEQTRRDLASQHDSGIERVNSRIDVVGEVVKTDRENNINQLALQDQARNELAIQVNDSARLSGKAVQLLREALEQQIENSNEDLRTTFNTTVNATVGDAMNNLRSLIEFEKSNRNQSVKEVLSIMDSRLDAMDRGALSREVQAKTELATKVEETKTLVGQSTSAIRDELLEIVNSMRSREIQTKVDFASKFEEVKLLTNANISEVKEELLGITNELKNRDAHFKNDVIFKIDESKSQSGDAIEALREEMLEITGASRARELQTRTDTASRIDDAKNLSAQSTASLREEIVSMVNAMKSRETQLKIEIVSKLEETKSTAGQAISAVRDELLEVTNTLREDIHHVEDRTTVTSRDQFQSAQEILNQRVNDISVRSDENIKRAATETSRIAEEKLSKLRIELNEKMSDLVRDSLTQGRGLAVQQIRSEVLRETDLAISNIKSDLMREMESTRRDVKALCDVSIEQSSSRVEMKLKEELLMNTREISMPLDMRLSGVAKKLDQTFIELSERIKTVDEDKSNVASTLVKLDVDLRHQVKQLKEFVAVLKVAVENLLSESNNTNNNSLNSLNIPRGVVDKNSRPSSLK